MDRIHKKISLESLRSRIPGSLLVVGDDSEGDNCIHYIPNDGNYGKLISDIEIPSKFHDTIRDYTDTDVLIKDASGSVYPMQVKGDSPISVTSGQTVYYIDFIEVEYPNSVIDGSTGYTKVNIPTIFSTDGLEVTKHMYLRYHTLLSWFKFFQTYYAALNVVICVEDGSKYRFNNFAELEELYPEIASEMDADYMRYMDDLAEIRGGSAFYDWLCENCFTTYTPPAGSTLPEHMYYSQVISEIAWFGTRNEKYSGVTSFDDCYDNPNCCECKEYLDKGGYEMYQWLTSLQPPDTSMCTKEAEITIPILINVKAKSLGNLSVFGEEWDKDGEYNKASSGEYTEGSMVLFEGRSFILNKRGKAKGGYNYSDKFQERIFGNQDPDSYNTSKLVYDDIADANKQWDDATSEYIGSDGNIPVVYSGYCESKLSSLRDTIQSCDDDCNDLPCTPKRSLDGKLKQAKKDAIFDIPYHPGNVSQLEDTDVDETYFGNIIVGCRYYIEDESGSTLYSVWSTPFNQIRDIEEAMSGVTGITESLMVDVYYMNGATIKRSNDIYYSPDIVYLENGEIDVENTAWFTILYKDTYKCVKKSVAYFIDRYHSFPIHYHKLDTDTLISSEYHLKTRFMSKDNGYNGMRWFPSYRNEVYLGISSREKRDVSIYIDRGTHALMERQMKLGEITNIDELVQYGNGFYDIK